MSKQALFAGLVSDEDDRPVEVVFVGGEPCYVVNDAGFYRHIPSEEVDRQVLNFMKDQIKGNESLLSDQTAKMLGQDDIFSRAIIEKQLKHIDDQFETLLQNGIPEEGRAYMGMLGMKIVINLHGEVVRIEQPSAVSGEGDE